MLIGIDVGGTFTDGVLFDGRVIKESVKRPTDNDNLDRVILEVLNELLSVVPEEKTVERIVLSTTLVTNLLATGKGKRTALILIPGYGLPHDAYQLSPDTFFITGAIDFRGREIEPISVNEIRALADKLKQMGIKRAAIAGKFSNRNRSHESQTADILKQEYPDLEVFLSCDIANQLNFPRRAATAYFTAMISREWQHFVDEVEKALQKRGADIEVHILKADGGTLPLDISRHYPCETIFSGPAASDNISIEPQSEQWGDRSVIIEKVCLLNQQGEERFTFRCGEPCIIEMKARVQQSVDDLVFGIGIFRQDNICCYGTNTYIDNYQVNSVCAGQEITVRCIIDRINLIPGEYFLDIAAHDHYGTPYDYQTRQTRISIYSDKQDIGICRLDHKWEVF